jgi:hypothetical protein
MAFKKALLWWIKTRWKPKGDMDVKLGILKDSSQLYSI